MIERYVSDTLRQRDTAGFAIHAVFDHDRGNALADLAQPTLVFNVRDDIYEATKRSMQIIKNGRFIDLSPTGLWPLETRTEEIAAAIETLRARLATGPFDLHRDFLAARGRTGPNSLGEPRLAQAWLARLGPA